MSLPSKVQRFVASERFLHWALAIPFLVLYASALVMLLFWGEPHPRHVRTAAAWVHKIAGAGLIVFPPLVLLLGIRGWRVHLSNIKEAWTWRAGDFGWLLLSPLAAVHPKIHLPEQGKFNAAEKLNFMMVCATYPVYIVTGLLIWAPGAAFTPWIIHLAVAALGAPLVVGHVFMATVNPSTRVGLQGMITGWVDREWAKHHYRRWFRERFERGVVAASSRSVRALLEQRAQIRCATCGEVHSFASWEQLLQRLFQARPLFCAKCEHEVLPALGQAAPDLAQTMLQQLQHAAVHERTDASTPAAARGNPTFAARSDPSPTVRGDPPPTMRSDPPPTVRSDPTSAVRVAPEAHAILWRPTAPHATGERDPAIPIYVRQPALAALHEQLRGDGVHGILGFFVGHLCTDPVTQGRWIDIQRVVRFAQALEGDETAPAMQRVWERLQQATERAGGSVLGWYHSRPAGVAELSPGDRETHTRYFPEPWQVSLALVHGAEGEFGAFYRPNGTPVDAHPALPFFEIMDRESITPEGKRRTRVTWKNYRPEVGASRSAAGAPRR